MMDLDTSAPEIAQVAYKFGIDYDGAEIHCEDFSKGSKKSFAYREMPGSDRYLADRLSRILRDVLQNYPAKAELQCAPTQRFLASNKMTAVLRFVWSQIQTTQTFLVKHHHRRDIAVGFENTLFYIADRHDIFENYARRSSQIAPGAVIIDYFSTGFNAMTRKFEKDTVRSPEEFVQYVIENRIRRIVSNNNYFLEFSLASHNTHILLVLEYLGVDVVLMDFDIPDYHGYYHRHAFSSDKTTRLSLFPHCQEPWDRLYEIKNVRYMSAEYLESDSDLLRPLKEPYSILIASNSRVADLLPHLNSLLWLLEKMNPENLVDDLQMWYFAQRTLLTTRSDLNLQQREFMNSILWTFYVNAISFLKFETIESLNSNFPILLYGDLAWKDLFPQYYQNEYISNTNYAEKLREDRYLPLLLNGNYSYLETNPVFQRAIQLGSPFLNFPALVHADDWAAFKEIEYRNALELNTKIGAINRIHESPDLLRARANHLRFIRQSVDENVKALSSAKGGESAIPNSFLKLANQTQEIFKQRLASYLSTREVALIEDARLLFSGEVDRVDWAPMSRFRDRSYLPRLINLRKK